MRTNPRVDVTIVGAWIVGLHAACLLQDSGLKVAVLEAREIGRQATGRSTAKITSQHGLKCTSLIRDFGKESAKLCADVNEKAKNDIADFALLLRLPTEIVAFCSCEVRIGSDPKPAPS